MNKKIIVGLVASMAIILTSHFKTESVWIHMAICVSSCIGYWFYGRWACLAEQRETVRRWGGYVIEKFLKEAEIMGESPVKKYYEQITKEESEEEMEIIHIAMLCHEVNRQYCRALGDESQPKWEDAPEWQKQSALNGVKFHMENEAIPSDSHVSWMKEKLEAGWKYGSVKDPEKKEHPCLVAYDDLPKEQKAKDYIFTAICSFFKNMTI